jgi:hypothetical protein
MGIVNLFLALLRKAYITWINIELVAIMCLLFTFKVSSVNNNVMFSFNQKSNIIIMVFINIQYS